MATVNGFSAEHMQEIADETVVAGLVDLAGNLLLERRNGDLLEAGNIMGPQGPKGDIGDSGFSAGIVLAWTSSTIPTNWLECDGQAVSRTTYADLFAIIGVTYGSGNGTTTFNVPDFRGRVLVGQDGSQMEFASINQIGGAKTHTHNEGDLAAAIGATNSDVNSLSYRARGVPSRGQGTVTAYTVFGNGAPSSASRGYNHYTEIFGTTAAESSLQPYRVVKYIIKATGDIGVVNSTVETALLNRIADLETKLATGPRVVIPQSVVVGSGSASVNPDGLITFSGCSSISLNGVFDGLAGDAYEIHGLVRGAADIGPSLNMRLRRLGVDLTTGYYNLLQWGISTAWSGITFTGQIVNNASSWTVGYRQYNSFDVTIKEPMKGGNNIEIAGLLGSDGTNQVAGPMMGRTPSVPGQDGFTIFPSSSTVSGWLKVVRIA